MIFSQFKRSRFQYLLATAIAFSLFSSLSSRATAQDKPTVVATTSVLCDLAKQIAEETINLKCLIDAGSDPHEYQPKPDDRKAIESAKLILYAGYNFEENLMSVIQAAPNSVSKVAVNEVAVPNPIKGDGHDHSGHNHSKSSEQTDPHVFHTADNGIKIANVINQSLTKIQPNQASTYTNNTKKLTNELSQIHTWIRSQIQTIPMSQRWLITTHDAFEYYARTYNLGVAATLQGISTDEKPTALRVAQLVKDIKTLGVPTIFAEMTVNPKLIEAVAREAKVKVSERKLYADGIGTPNSEADSYPKMLIANTRTIVEGLGGKYTPFKLK
ncbi:metal ABC transporter solute-binding protein, Zn/Mn family [Leptolyngbya sp. AN03gr2]|uniref:metal ABC transporter solute-binding protein, Zn/Mn family n=1 Tax=unclassified Leptolyngbya TaxID=2650499 RepID=UPI003D31EBBC